MLEKYPMLQSNEIVGSAEHLIQQVNRQKTLSYQQISNNLWLSPQSADNFYVLFQVKNFDYEGDSTNSGAPYPVPQHLGGTLDGSTISESIIKTIGVAAPGMPSATNIASTTGTF